MGRDLEVLSSGGAWCAQGPVGVANKHVETAIDEASGKLTMLYQVRSAATTLFPPNTVLKSSGSLSCFGGACVP